MARYIDTLKDLGGLLLMVEKPARYTGGEYGMLAKADAPFQTVIAFPDLYELGMSNQALRILYNRLNALPGVSCDRAFTPAPDFEKLIKERGIPLYGLDTGIALCDTDMLMFTLGYELGMTGMLAILDTAHIPLRTEERGDGYPIVIAGGPCVSNPLPYARFIDAFWIGEAEDGFFQLAEELAGMKTRGAKREMLAARIASHPSVWVKGKKKAVRAIDTNFSARGPETNVFPVPSMRITQHHGVVEIMRGCPNGCRFCHAGVWYRPMRQKDANTIEREAAKCIAKTGYREISLSSLSSGDYRHIESLIDRLNSRFAAQRVSFQLPSLHISTFSLPILEKISHVRKSGLTFAVETPLDNWQAAINKQIDMDSVVSIMAEAKRNGWRQAKLYFMIGLPVEEEAAGISEDDAIIAFVKKLSGSTGLKFSINIGVFVPKPHTPFQWSAQIEEGRARQALHRIRDQLKRDGHKVSIHDPFMAIVEGLISRGDERVGELIEQAYTAGCRLDAWSDFFREDVWKRIAGENADYVGQITGGRKVGDSLAWDIIYSNISKNRLEVEYEKSQKYTRNNILCIKECMDRCGVCLAETEIVENNIRLDNNNPENTNPEINISGTPLVETQFVPSPAAKSRDPKTYRILFSFSKEGRAVFLPHLALIEVFSMAALRAGAPVLYTSGFNPMPRLDFAAPLSIGVSAYGEIASVDTQCPFSGGEFRLLLNKVLPEGISITDAFNCVIPSGAKKHSIASLLWGFEYDSGGRRPDYVASVDEKAYRKERCGDVRALYGLSRLRVLARSGGGWASYFDVYGGLYAPDSTDRI
ncbi:MAG: TIGR03936 family radical SAM-associated protein [Spirochaetaceae bacterium]|jgi:radical SAM superfamily enzyme YgiQ (UPF0313 family)|nr:TIGR03936 family radical SAM-associated protein [Spirochaetaceae bacterium]